MTSIFINVTTKTITLFCFDNIIGYYTMFFKMISLFPNEAKT